MRRIILTLGALLICLSTTPGLAQIYKSVDKNGHTTYTDTPPPNTNAKPVELKSLNTTPAVNPGTVYSSPVPEIGPEDYALNLTAPENGKTLMPDERSLTISVNLNRPLQNDDLLAYKLDGQVIAKTTDSTYTLVEPPRGEHSVSVTVIDLDGQELAQSEAITVVVMRPLIKHLPFPVPKK
jgi:hypothetical protein